MLRRDIRTPMGRLVNQLIEATLLSSYQEMPPRRRRRCFPARLDSEATRYVLANAFEKEVGHKKPPAGRVDQTTLNSLDLEVGRSFGYWFDFGDDWWHQIDVTAIEEKVPAGKYPKVTKKVGKSPPQYADE